MIAKRQIVDDNTGQLVELFYQKMMPTVANLAYSR